MVSTAARALAGAENSSASTAPAGTGKTERSLAAGPALSGVTFQVAGWGGREDATRRWGLSSGSRLTFTAPPLPEPENSQPRQLMSSRSRTAPPPPPIQAQGIAFRAEGFFFRRRLRAGGAGPAGPGSSSVATGTGSGRGGGGALGRALRVKVVRHDGHFMVWRVASGESCRGSPHLGQGCERMKPPPRGRVS
jgi:hypothetical protein